MAKSITKRTLVGFKDISPNATYFDDLNNMMRNKSKQFINRITRANYWKKKGSGKMKFDAVVGNPPYQEMDGGAQASASLIYHHFVMTAKSLNPKFFSFIMPTRWYVGGKGLDAFRNEMLSDVHIKELYDCLTPEDIFPNPNADRRVNTLLSGLEKIISAVAEMRNKDGDAHGVGAARLSIEEHHARLFVNAAISMADFILSVENKQNT